MKDLFVVGDVQGCHAELLELLSVAKFDRARHQLASVGDLINRGPSSKAVLELMRDFDAWVVLGNHEDGLLAGKQSDTLDRVRRELGADLPEWLLWIDALPVYREFGRELGRELGHELENLILVHAGIAPGKRPAECTRGELTRIREVDGVPWFESWKGPETVIYGHWAMMGKVDRPLVKGLDTGCVYGRSLTGIWWPRCEWVSVPAHRVWFDMESHRPTW